MLSPAVRDKMLREIQAVEERAKTDPDLAQKLAQAKAEARAENQKAVAGRMCGPGELAILHGKLHGLGLL